MKKTICLLMSLLAMAGSMHVTAQDGGKNLNFADFPEGYIFSPDEQQDPQSLSFACAMLIVENDQLKVKQCDVDELSAAPALKVKLCNGEGKDTVVTVTQPAFYNYLRVTVPNILGYLEQQDVDTRHQLMIKVQAFLDAHRLPVSESEASVKGEAHSIVASDDAVMPTSYSKMSDLDAANFTDIHAYIRSKVSGTYRGPSSVNAGTDPIYVVDGMQVSSIDGMSPRDIYSVEFLKDAAATIYGVRGANGVFNIVTKAAHQQKEAEAAARKAARAERRAKRHAGK